MVEAIGAPTASVKDRGQSCDVYKLYTRGPGGVGKGAIAAGEAVGDVLTLGLTEVVFTPIEGGTRNERHTVTFCYNEDNKLLSLNDSLQGLKKFQRGSFFGEYRRPAPTEADYQTK